MKRPSTRRAAVRRLLTLISGGALLTPIGVYIFKFGITISNDHERWAEMGAAFGGIYAPIFSFFALLVLISQARMQNTQTRMQHEMNIYQHDQAYIEEARKDVEFYLEQLDRELTKEAIGEALRGALQSGFARADMETLHSEQARSVAEELNRRFPKILSLWSAIYPLFAGLSVVDRYPYQHNFLAAKQKATVILTFETCVALDNYAHCVSEGRLGFPYQFSPVLASSESRNTTVSVAGS